MKIRFGVSRPYWETMKADHWPDFNWLVEHDLTEIDLAYRYDVKCRHNYNPSYHPSLNSVARHAFPGLEKITASYSQSMQDIFALTLLNGKSNGTYLELGAREPINFNNTYLLSQFGWNGISIDINESLTEKWVRDRAQDIFIAHDAFSLDYEKLLNQYKIPKQIDYLQIDIDHPEQHLVLKDLLDSGFRFSVITYEHSEQDVSSLLLTHGYVKLIENITYLDFELDSHIAYEDWWIDPSVINPAIQQKFLTIGKNKVYPFELFCLPNSVDHLMPAVLKQKNIWGSIFKSKKL